MLPSTDTTQLLCSLIQPCLHKYYKVFKKKKKHLTKSTLIRQYYIGFHIQRLYIISAALWSRRLLYRNATRQLKVCCQEKKQRGFPNLLRGVQTCSHCNRSSAKVNVVLEWLHVQAPVKWRSAVTNTRTGEIRTQFQPLVCLCASLSPDIFGAKWLSCCSATF